jgi:hypothetical protein
MSDMALSSGYERGLRNAGTIGEPSQRAGPAAHGGGITVSVKFLDSLLLKPFTTIV